MKKTTKTDAEIHAEIKAEIQAEIQAEADQNTVNQAVAPPETETPRSYGSGNNSRYGYVVEWKLREGVGKMISFGPDRPAYGTLPEGTWGKANYGKVSNPPPSSGGRTFVHPKIQERDEGMLTHGLVTRRVAEATLACLKTMLPGELLPLTEWRIIEVHIKESYSMTITDDGSDDIVSVDDMIADVEARLRG